MSKIYTDLNPSNFYRPEEEASFGENFQAAFGYQYSPIISRAQEQIYFGSAEKDPYFNVWDNVEGYEGFEQDLSRAKNAGHLNFIKQGIDKNRSYRETLGEADFFSGALVAGLVDPLNLSFALPIVGQLGLIAKTGMTVRQAAVASAKGGFVAGAAAETVRAPFDPINTTGESAFNLLTATAFSTVLGTAASAVFNPNGMYARSAAKLRNLNKGDIGDEIDGTRIVYADDVDADVSVRGEEIVVNSQRIDKEFDARSWATESENLPEGVEPIPVDAFNEPAEYRQFLINKENYKKQEPKKAGESDADFTNRTNEEALARTYSGYAIKKTAFTNSIWNRLIPTPAKTILLDSEVPTWVKRSYQLMEGNAAMAMEQNIAGRGTQSIRQRLPVYTVRAHNLLQRVRRGWNEEVNGQGTKEIAGIDLNKGQKRKMVGMKTKFDEWFEDTMNMYLEASDPAKQARVMQNATKAQKDAFEFIRKYQDDFLQSSQDVGLLRNIKNINAYLKTATTELDEINVRQQEIDLSPPAPTKAAEIEKLNARRLELEEEIQYYNGYREFAGSRSEYILPIYYDKQLLSTSEAAREELTSIFEHHFAKETKYWYDGEKGAPGKWIDKDPSYDNRGAAERVLRRILEEDGDELVDAAISPKGGKHLSHRAVDIPEYLIKDFIIKNEALFYTYSEKMGRKIEWTRNFGDQKIETILDKIDADMTAAGVKESKIAKVKAAFMGDYERVMGRLIQNPDSLTNQSVRAIKEVAGLTYLHGAGISAIVDTAMLVFERGVGKTVAPLLNKEAKPLFVKAMDDIDTIVDQTGLLRGMIQDRYIGDSIRGIQPNAVERFFNPITNAYYNIPLLGNNLGIVTRYGKVVDGVYRQSELIRMSVDVAKNRASASDVEYLARYGIGTDDAKKIAGLQGAWETDPSGRFYYANRKAWPTETKLDRDLALKFDTAMNSGVGNTIMHATSFDKPLMADGATYVRWYPWMENLTLGKLKRDPRVSTANVAMTKIETGILGMPFQFMSFTLAATNRITAQMFDPARQHRLAGAMSLFALSYLSLSIKKPDWWFESKSNSELAARIADHSGIFGVYADLFYIANHAAIENGINEQNWDILKGRYKVKDGDSLWDASGAGPGMVREWYKATENMLNGQTNDAKKGLYYNTPSLPLLGLMGLNEDMRDFFTK